MTNTIEALLSRNSAIRIPAGDYFIIPTADLNIEEGNWPIGFEESPKGFYTDPDGTIISLADFDYYSTLMNNAQFFGNANGFRYGISLRSENDLTPKDVDFLLKHELCLKYTVAEDSIFINMDEVDETARIELGITEETIYALVSPTNVLDIYSLFN